MGSQIAVAQSERDEQDANEWLRSRSDLLCLPRFTDEPRPEPRQLVEMMSGQEVLFLKDAAQDVLDNWVRCEPTVGEGQSSHGTRYHLFPKALACIEFTRTTRMQDGRVIAGRYYLDTGKRRVLEERFQREIRKIMTSLASWIKRNYPRRSTWKPPIFIGPDLATELTDGRKRLVYRNGTSAVELE